MQQFKHSLKLDKIISLDNEAYNQMKKESPQTEQKNSQRKSMTSYNDVGEFQELKVSNLNLDQFKSSKPDLIGEGQPKDPTVVLISNQLSEDSQVHAGRNITGPTAQMGQSETLGSVQSPYPSMLPKNFQPQMKSPGKNLASSNSQQSIKALKTQSQLTRNAEMQANERLSTQQFPDSIIAPPRRRQRRN